MKVRNSFVSNSSSSSFVILKEHLTSDQIDKILNHMDYLKNDIFPKLNEDEKQWWSFEPDDKWDIEERHKTICGRTNMDNFNMYAFLERIGINRNFIEESYE